MRDVMEGDPGRSHLAHLRARVRTKSTKMLVSRQDGRDSCGAIHLAAKPMRALRCAISKKVPAMSGHWRDRVDPEQGSGQLDANTGRPGVRL